MRRVMKNNKMIFKWNEWLSYCGTWSDGKRVVHLALDAQELKQDGYPAALEGKIPYCCFVNYKCGFKVGELFISRNVAVFLMVWIIFARRVTFGDTSLESAPLLKSLL